MSRSHPEQPHRPQSSAQQEDMTSPVCDRVLELACPFADGRRCGLDQYLSTVSTQLRAAVTSKLSETSKTNPQRLTRLCQEQLHGGKTIIGVMGPGEGATPEDIAHAYTLGELIAEQGWVLLTGGRPVGVMEAANQGAKSAKGLTVGILPSTKSTETNTSAAVDIRIVTGMHEARNAVNVLSSDVIIACGMGTGTASEIALALKAGKHVVLLTSDPEAQAFFSKVGQDRLTLADSPEQAVGLANTQLIAQIAATNRRSSTPKRPE